MGAFGAALIARERYMHRPHETTMLSLDDMINLTYTTTMSRCRGCVNHCVLTINRFEGGRQYVSGNAVSADSVWKKQNAISRTCSPGNTTESSTMSR